MGQKTNPIGNRLGIIRGWDSNWYGGRRFETKLVEDDKIRKYLNARLAKASISKIYIERTLKLLTVTINTARPGLIIGKAGSEVDKLKEELKKLTGKDVQINISEVKRPNWTPFWLPRISLSRLKAVCSTVAPSRTPLSRQCVLEQRVSRSPSLAVSAEPKSHVASITKRVVPRCTPSVPTSTMPMPRPTPRMAVSA